MSQGLATPVITPSQLLLVCMNANCVEGVVLELAHVRRCIIACPRLHVTQVSK